MADSSGEAHPGVTGLSVPPRSSKGAGRRPAQRGARDSRRDIATSTGCWRPSLSPACRWLPPGAGRSHQILHSRFWLSPEEHCKKTNDPLGKVLHKLCVSRMYCALQAAKFLSLCHFVGKKVSLRLKITQEISQKMFLLYGFTCFSSSHLWN